MWSEHKHMREMVKQLSSFALRKCHKSQGWVNNNKRNMDLFGQDYICRIYSRSTPDAECIKKKFNNLALTKFLI